MKKGIAQQTLLLLIILLATAAVLSPVIARAGTWVQGYADGGVCGASAAMASMELEKACVIKVESPVALNCPRRNIVLGDAAYLSVKGERQKMQIPDYSVSAEVVAKVFADETLSCWKKFGSGQVALFPEVPTDIWGSIEGDDSDKTGCHICSEIYFAEDNGLLENRYLEAVAQKIPGKEKTYLDELNNDDAYCQARFDTGVGCWSAMASSWDERPVMNEIDTSKAYAVTMIRRGFEICQEGEKGELSNFVSVIPQDQIASVCDWVVT